ncbi:MAG: hypothetical protein MJA30_12105 [Cytophagales bacterium]|nr:hypothetical protein [Cytophagales bacterium]
MKRLSIYYQFDKRWTAPAKQGFFLVRSDQAVFDHEKKAWNTRHGVGYVKSRL